jgi:hypothetical protein
MTLLFSLLLIWIICAPACYLLLREDHIATQGRWKQIDRVFWLSISLVYGPVMLIALIGVSVFNRLNASKWGQREARW